MGPGPSSRGAASLSAALSKFPPTESEPLGNIQPCFKSPKPGQSTDTVGTKIWNRAQDASACSPHTGHALSSRTELRTLYIVHSDMHQGPDLPAQAIITSSRTTTTKGKAGNLDQDQAQPWVPEAKWMNTEV